MKKNAIRGCVALAIVAVVFSVIVFVLPFEKNGVFVLSYLFALIALAVQIGVFAMAFQGGETARSKFYGVPIVRVGIVYLVVQMVMSLIFICVAQWVPVWVPVILYVVALGAAALGLIAADTMRDEIVRQDEVLKKDVSTMRTLQSKAASLPGTAQDEELKKALQDLSDAFRFSDPVSSDAVADSEANLTAGLDEVQQAVLDGDKPGALALIQKLTVTLAERNRLCKLGKAKKN